MPWGSAPVLGVAYAANTGGMATLVGTPPNAALAGVAADRFGIDIGFAEWMQVGLPVSAVVLTAVYLGLVGMHRVPKSAGEGATAEVVRRELAQLGAMGTAERRVLVLFVGTALLWMFRRPLNLGLEPLGLALNDTSVAVVAAIACCASPANRGSAARPSALLEAEDLKRLPWDILLLFGGGLALAKGFELAGWASVLAEGAAGLGWSQWGMLVLVTALGLFATELMSNLALTLLLTPAGALAAGMGLHPVFRRAGGPRLEWGLHAAHGHAPQCHRVFFRPVSHLGHGPRGGGVQPDGPRHRARVVGLVGPGGLALTSSNIAFLSTND